jgi:hypothetical protein
VIEVSTKSNNLAPTLAEISTLSLMTDGVFLGEGVVGLEAAGVGERVADLVLRAVDGRLAGRGEGAGGVRVDRAQLLERGGLLLGLRAVVVDDGARGFQEVDRLAVGVGMVRAAFAHYEGGRAAKSVDVEFDRHPGVVGVEGDGVLAAHRRLEVVVLAPAVATTRAAACLRSCR